MMIKQINKLKKEAPPAPAAAAEDVLLAAPDPRQSQEVASCDRRRQMQRCALLISGAGGDEFGGGRSMKILDRWRLLPELCGLAAVVWLPRCRECANGLPLFDGPHSLQRRRHPAVLRRSKITAFLDEAGIRQALLSSTPNDRHHRTAPSGIRNVYSNASISQDRDLATWSIERRSWYRDPET